MADNFCILVL